MTRASSNPASGVPCAVQSNKLKLAGKSVRFTQDNRDADNGAAAGSSVEGTPSMDKLVIVGGAKLSGEIVVSGAKNAALPILCASLLTADDVHLENVPNLQDVRTMLKLLNQMGLRSESADGKVWLNVSKVDNLLAPYEMVKTMRASILVLGPLLARFGEAKVSLPGGCAIGVRPVDIHLEGLRALGANIDLSEGYIIANAPQGLRGTDFTMPLVSVTATENLLMAA